MARAPTAAAAAAALLLAGACALLFASPASAEAYEWTVYRNNLKAMTVPGLKGTVGDRLGEFLEYKFTLPIEFMRRSQSYVGPRTRLRRVVNDMLSGKKVEVAVLGGSISAGAVASRKMAAVDPNDVWNLVRIELQTHLSPKIDFFNNARSATKSYITSICLDRFLNATADLVFVEFIANDGSEMDTQLQGPLDKTRSFERFLRKIQAQPSDPAVVMMQMLVNEMAYPVGGRDGKPKRAFYSTPEDTYGNLAQYYDIPAISFRDALWQLGDNNRDGATWEDFMGDDRLHPNDKGHQLMADMVVFLIQQTALDLLMHPLTQAEISESRGPLPPPMFEGNEGSTDQTCAQGKNMTAYVKNSIGWAIIPFEDNAKYPTFGYETTTVGAPLVLEVDTTKSVNKSAGAGVVISYTKGKTGYGNMTISCGNGCECEKETIDGSVPYNQKVVFLAEVQPTPAPACQISIALDESSPAGSKIRISGIVVTGDPGVVEGRVGEEKYMAWLSGDAWAA
ncbi:hypothetical protein Rsub_04343 [Raphidocelis subcapitata]|uniref:SGNH hydrolase-type esterase domain-containing protein n=1 Tax=Raphidocelis subcapitata TaxID=307507 RepID=A0A2V0P187_9CHLO|nr:hypothetical protein Rsub_04343 [Raphidocelis subcapitata]|eukprot:GBF91603.1 hypothetical protein Rsub_04343 [Raphidocelis subcapitata]